MTGQSKMYNYCNGPNHFLGMWYWTILPNYGDHSGEEEKEEKGDLCYHKRERRSDTKWFS